MEVEEEMYPFWMFLVRMCAVIGGVYATVGMVYNHMSLLGCSMRKFSGDREKKEAYAAPSNYKPGHKKSGSISSNILTANSLVPPPSATFEAPVVQLVGSTTTEPQIDLTKSPESDSISNGLSNGQPFVAVPQLPDLLASSQTSS